MTTTLQPTALERIDATIDRSEWTDPSSWKPEVMSFDLEALRSIQRDLATNRTPDPNRPTAFRTVQTRDELTAYDGPLYVLYVQRPER